MIHNRNTLAAFPRPTSHLGKTLLDHYAPAGRPMPIAVVIGADPLSHFAAAATYLLGGNEAELAGALRGRPVRLVRCLTSDLLVPAEAEIVIEAQVLPDRVVPEGPYGEYPGYRTGEMGRGVAARVTAITHRARPLLTVDATGYKDDSSTVTAFSGAVTIKRRLQRHGLPVRQVYVPPEGAVHWAVVSVDRGGPEVCRAILATLTSRRALLSKIMVVDADVDVFRIDQVLHAFATKCHPVRGVHVAAYEGRANTLTPCYSQDERARQAGATVAFDCTWPPDWSRETEVPVKATFDEIYAPEVRRRVMARWAELGLEAAGSGSGRPVPARAGSGRP
jgi:UbiD family decarboxylase